MPEGRDLAYIAEGRTDQAILSIIPYGSTSIQEIKMPKDTRDYNQSLSIEAAICKSLAANHGLIRN